MRRPANGPSGVTEIARLQRELADAEGRARALEQTLEQRNAVCHGLEQLLEEKARDRWATLEAMNRQARVVGEQNAVQALIDAGSLARAAPALLRAIGEALDWEVALLWGNDAGSNELRLVDAWSSKPKFEDFLDAMRTRTFREGVGLPGRVWADAAPAAVLDLAAEPTSPRAEHARAAGLHSSCAFPIVIERSDAGARRGAPVRTRVAAVVELVSGEWRSVDAELLASLAALGEKLGGMLDLQRAKEAIRDAELSIARRVQTALLPRDLSVAGLEIAARMLPAEDVGGDYYDVVPVPDGCWIGIGDVTGHGMSAGLVSLMTQSALAALVRSRAGAAPSELLPTLNAVLYDNVHERLGRGDHVTLSLLRFYADGRFAVAGAHEELVVYRAAKDACDVAPTPGTWLGAMPNVAAFTKDTWHTLAPGDVVLLHTDGLTEAMDTERRQFGIERVAELLRDARGEPVERIRDRVFDALLAWAPSPADDVTVLVARYVGGDQRSP